MSRLPAPPLPARISRHLPDAVRRSRVELSDVAVHVMEQGEGRPVVMVHGNPTWSFQYRRVFEALTDEPLHLIAADLPGLGLSDRVPFPWHTLQRHGDRMGELLEALDVRDAVFVGQDWGGPIGGLGFAAQPSRLAAMVVLNTVIGPPRPGFKPTAFHRFSQLRGLSDLAFRLGGFPQRALKLAQGDPASIGPDVSYAYTWPLEGTARNAAPLALARMVPDTPAHPSMAALERLGTFVSGFAGPTAIVWGDRDPILGRVRSHVERTLPDARVWRTQAGHFLQEEVPHVIADAIRYVVEELS